MRIGIIGTGISGLVCAHLLKRENDITVFEAADVVGGHTRTVDVELAGRTWSVDTGFIVFNERSYPGFVALLDQLGVASQPAPMTFSVRCDRTGLEYSGASLNALFAQRRNLFRLEFLRMLVEIARFNRRSRRLLLRRGPGPVLGDYLEAEGYSDAFAERYLLPLTGAIWSSESSDMRQFPASYLVRFFDHHGLLTMQSQTAWRVIQGGSRNYVDRIVGPLGDRVRTGTPIENVQRHPDGVTVRTASGETHRFDHVVIATHSDQALELLTDPSPAEREVLGAMRYQENVAVLHTDASLLPRSRRAWAAWNFRVPRESRDRVTVSYHMNQLQSLDAPEELIVTLNDEALIDPDRVVERIVYHHPLYDPAAVAAQERHDEISGRNRTSYCGAYWGWGFHEDGLQSALRVCEPLGARL